MQQYADRITGLEKERDFYYQKLRDVENVCQEPEVESLPHTQKILEVLYATEVRTRDRLAAHAFVRLFDRWHALTERYFQGRL